MINIPELIPGYTTLQFFPSCLPTALNLLKIFIEQNPKHDVQHHPKGYLNQYLTKINTHNNNKHQMGFHIIGMSFLYAFCTLLVNKPRGLL